MYIGDILKELRMDKGLTQEELSDTFNISRTAISKYENGEREPNLDFLIKFCDYFDVSIDYVVGRTRIPSRYTLVQSLDCHSNANLKKINLIINKLKNSKYIDPILDLINNIDNMK